jgi:flagellar motor switch protein FliG
MATAALGAALTGAHKTAALLVALGDEASASLMKHLSDDEIERVSAAIANLPAVALEQSRAVLEEFQEAVTDALQLGRGGPDYARRVLTQAFGPDGSKKHIERLPPEAGQPSALHTQLHRVEAGTLARFVRSEHPQTVALILSRLGPAQSAAVLQLMEPELRADVAVRVARLDRISNAVVEKLAKAVGMKLKPLSEVRRESSDGRRAMAAICNQMDATQCDELLQQIGEGNAELAEQIRQKMFVFDDLLSIDAAGIRELLSRADRRQLMIALKGAGEELRKHLMKGLSQRGAAMLLEDMEGLGAIKIRDVEEAQQQVIAVVRLLESEGVISRNKGDGKSEQYL